VRMLAIEGMMQVSKPHQRPPMNTATRQRMTHNTPSSSMSCCRCSNANWVRPWCVIARVTAIAAREMPRPKPVAPPLMSTRRVTSLHDLMDSAYCSSLNRAHRRSLGYVPLNDHNRAHGEHPGFAPHKALRFRERSSVERVNARLKDNFGLRRVNVRGATKVTAHLMFTVLALSADQLLRWVT